MGKQKSQKTLDDCRSSTSANFPAVNSGEFMPWGKKVGLNSEQNVGESLPRVIAQLGKSRGRSLVGSFWEFLDLGFLGDYSI